MGTNQEIKEVNGAFIIEGGTGDSCNSTKQISKFNPATKTLTPIISMADSCGEGSKYLGIDSNDRIIVQYRHIDSDNKSNIILDKLEAIPISNLTAKKELIMPKDISTKLSGGWLSKNKSKIYMTTNSQLYVYDLLTDTLKPPVDYKESYDSDYQRYQGMGELKDGVFCYKVSANEYMGYYSDNGNEVKNDPDCKNEVEANREESRGYNRIEELKQKLDLPKDYTFALEESKFYNIYDQ